jgi:hypothetical protein
MMTMSALQNIFNKMYMHMTRLDSAVLALFVKNERAAEEAAVELSALTARAENAERLLAEARAVIEALYSKPEGDEPWELAYNWLEENPEPKP